MARRRGDAVSVAALDRVFLRRTYELAERGRGSTAPNPCVGALVTREGRTLGEGFHHARGSPHAEVEALEAARRGGNDLRGATLYVSLEPCAHAGLTPACTSAVAAAGIARVVIGARDPNPLATGGAAHLRDGGIAVDVAGDPFAEALIDDFEAALNLKRPYVSLKMAASLDGFVAEKPGSAWLTGERVRDFVRELRIAHDAILVGAQTTRIDDPQLTVRPPRTRARSYRRVIACGSKPVSPAARVFEASDGYERTIVLAPAGHRDLFAPLEPIANVLYVGDENETSLDIAAGLEALKALGVYSVLCEGGPRLASSLIERRLVDRLHWIVAPLRLANEHAIPALAQVDVARALSEGQIAAALPEFRFFGVERLGDDLAYSARRVSAKKD